MSIDYLAVTCFWGCAEARTIVLNLLCRDSSKDRYVMNEVVLFVGLLLRYGLVRKSGLANNWRVHRIRHGSAIQTTKHLSSLGTEHTSSFIHRYAVCAKAAEDQNSICVIRLRRLVD